MIKCPFCHAECKASGKEWNYAAFHVKRASCKKCGAKFNAFYKNGNFSHTIPKAKK
jgi:transcriptional regulator NrdR family protein